MLAGRQQPEALDDHNGVDDLEEAAVGAATGASTGGRDLWGQAPASWALLAVKAAAVAPRRRRSGHREGSV